ncbi:hypothetical protein RJT34_30333 [Clitoria ternatea]|uniref:Uncharacterized protein n=1 Tax=Clitoria ternatea TaxID=43366 RepID=A0AAN9ET38_CLITE
MKAIRRSNCGYGDMVSHVLDCLCRALKILFFIFLCFHSMVGFPFDGILSLLNASASCQSSIMFYSSNLDAIVLVVYVEPWFDGQQKRPKLDGQILAGRVLFCCFSLHFLKQNVCFFLLSHLHFPSALVFAISSSAVMLLLPLIQHRCSIRRLVQCAVFPLCLNVGLLAHGLWA